MTTWGKTMGSLALAAAAVAVAAAAPVRAANDVFVVTTDYQTGSTAYLPAGAETAQTNLLTIHGDAGVRYQDGTIYIINRLGQDNILVLDAGDPATPLRQFSVGNGSNPQDIAVVSPERAYVTRYEVPSMLIVNPSTGDSLGHVDLSAFADDDGVPEMGEMVLRGQRLYVALQRLDRSGFPWVPVDVSYLAVIDAATGEVIDVDPDADGVQGHQLAGVNPNSLISVGDRIAVSTTAAFGDMEGGVELIDPVTGVTTGLVVTEEDLGGDLTHLSVASATKAYAIVSDASYVNSVRPVNLLSGEVGAPLAGLTGGFLQSTATDGDRLYVAERGSFTQPEVVGLMVYDTVTDQLVAGPIDTGLPPAVIAVLSERHVTAVAEAADRHLPRRADLGRAYPNPFNASTVIPVELDVDGPVELQVRDLLGRSVRTLTAGHLPAGRHAIAWDGRDDAGRVAATGAYLVELRAAGLRATRKVTLLK